MPTARVGKLGGRRGSPSDPSPVRDFDRPPPPMVAGPGALAERRAVGFQGQDSPSPNPRPGASPVPGEVGREKEKSEQVASYKRGLTGGAQGAGI